MKLAELNRLPDLQVVAPATARTGWQQQHVRVDYTFPVVSTRDAFDIANPDFRAVVTLREPQRRHRLAIFLDEGLARAMPGLVEQILAYLRFHHEAMELAGEIYLLRGGEVCKNDASLVERLLQALSERAIDRHSYSIAIGGGAVLDAVGYASAIFHRGVRHIRFPTTVLDRMTAVLVSKMRSTGKGKKTSLAPLPHPGQSSMMHVSSISCPHVKSGPGWQKPSRLP